MLCMAQGKKRARKYRKEKRGGPKYAIDNSKSNLQEKQDKKEAESSIDLKNNEDWD